MSPVSLKSICFAVLSVTLLLTFSSCASEKHVPTEMPYSVIDTSDVSIGSQKRLSYAIISEQATTLEQRANTVRRAARDLQEQSKAARVWVLLEPDRALKGLGYSVAIAEMENGTLSRLEAAPSSYSAQDVSVISTVSKLQKQFAEDRTDEPRFAAVAKALNISPEAVRESVKTFSRILTERHAYSDPHR